MALVHNQHCDGALNNSLICSEYCNFIEFGAERKDYNCNICGKRYLSRKAAKGHVFANHPELQSQTNLSRELILSQTQTNFEIESDTEGFIKLNFTMDEGNKLDNSNQSTNNLNDNSLNMRTCKYCSREFISKGIGAHERYCQNKPKANPEDDDISGNDAATKNQMNNSQKVLENVEDTNLTLNKTQKKTSISKLKCDICGYIGCKPIDLKAHYPRCKKYHKFIINMWTCKICNKECFKGKVFQHIEKNHKMEIEAEIDKTAEESSENSNFNQDTDNTNLVVQPQNSPLIPKSGKSKAKNNHDKVEQKSVEIENSILDQKSNDTNLNLQPEKMAKSVADNQFHEKSEKSNAKNSHKKVNKAMEMDYEEFETNVDPDLTQNDSMNETQTSSNFTKEDKSILKQFYAEIPNPTDEEIETLAQQIEKQSEKVHKWFQYKKSEKQKKCITCLKNFSFLFDWKKQLKKHITEGCQQTEKQNFDNSDKKFSGQQNGKKDLKKHNGVTHEKPQISCDFCLDNFEDDSSLEDHMKKEHPKENMISKSTLSTAKPVLDRFFHEKIHDKRKKSKKCTFCEEIFDTKNNWKRDMRRHIERDHPNEEIPENLLKASTKSSMLAIEFHGNSQENVNKNTSQTEPETEQSIGNEIDGKIQDIKKFLSGIENQTDTDETHEDDSESKSNNVITNKCKICEKIFKGRNSKANLNRHVRQIHEKIEFRCDFCNKSYADDSSVRLHIKNAHPDKKLPPQFTVTKPQITLEKCSFCNEEFEKPENLKIHEKFCESQIDDPHPTTDNNSKTDSRSENISENVQSISNKNLKSMSKCQHCNDSCSSKHLKIHEKTCNKYFPFIAKIDNSNYQCQLCSNICSSRSESYKHVSKEHNDIINKKEASFDTSTVYGEENRSENPNKESLEPTISFEDTNEDPLEPISKRSKIDSDGENDNDDNDSEISVFKFSHPPSGGGGSEFGGRSEISLDNTDTMSNTSITNYPMMSYENSLVPINQQEVKQHVNTQNDPYMITRLLICPVCQGKFLPNHMQSHLVFWHKLPTEYIGKMIKNEIKSMDLS